MAKNNLFVRFYYRPVVVIVVAVLVVIAVFAAWLSAELRPANSADHTVVEIEIRQGAGLEEIAANLNSKKLIKNTLAYIIYSRLTGAKVEAGRHNLSPNMSSIEIIASLNTAGQDRYDLMIRPEMTITEIKKELMRYDFSQSEIDAAFNKKYDHPLLADKPVDYDLEGYIFPDTYEMHTNDTVEDLLKKAFDNLYGKLQADGSLARMATRDLTIYETLTFASVVAKEVPEVSDQKMVAGVFWNRLDQGIVMGSDVTFHYAYNMGYCDIDGPDCDSKYNTRLYDGLPPGPIANMKYATIQAVLDPTASDFFYFLAGDDGELYYAATEDEHQMNIVNYCQQMCW